MLRSSSLLAGLVASLTFVGSACESRALFRLAEVEITTDANGTIQRDGKRIEHKSTGELDEIETEDEGDFAKRREFTYANGRIVETKTVFARGDPVELEAEYTGELLTELNGKQGNETWTVEFLYFSSF